LKSLLDKTKDFKVSNRTESFTQPKCEATTERKYW